MVLSQGKVRNEVELAQLVQGAAEARDQQEAGVLLEFPVHGVPRTQLHARKREHPRGRVARALQNDRSGADHQRAERRGAELGEKHEQKEFQAMRPGMARTAHVQHFGPSPFRVRATRARRENAALLAVRRHRVQRIQKRNDAAVRRAESTLRQVRQHAPRQRHRRRHHRPRRPHPPAPLRHLPPLMFSKGLFPEAQQHERPHPLQGHDRQLLLPPLRDDTPRRVQHSFSLLLCLRVVGRSLLQRRCFSGASAEELPAR
mmetsp:Transcript_18777/g.57766  ORF Transcript_18777/g.57766 Transcript_18777/m.57766 type:complete len:259 (-) Transcript_18777:19-795(-)